MGEFAVGQVVTLAFPYSDLQSVKRRPALILANAARGDWVLCQITSQAFGDNDSIRLDMTDFDYGTLNLLSYVRPLKLFTAHDSLFKSTVGALHTKKLIEIKHIVANLLTT
jgi:mRNA interferase MazF